MNHRDFFALIKKFAGQANVLTIPRALITFAGDIKTALLLSQIIYWSDKTKNEDGWFYKTFKEWEEETSLTKKEVRRARKILEENLKIIATEVKKVGGDTVLHYRLKTDVFWRLFHGSPKGKYQKGTSRSAERQLPYIRDHRLLSETTESYPLSLKVSPFGKRGNGYDANALRSKGNGRDAHKGNGRDASSWAERLVEQMATYIHSSRYEPLFRKVIKVLGPGRTEEIFGETKHLARMSRLNDPAKYLTGSLKKEITAFQQRKDVSELVDGVAKEMPGIIPRPV